MLFIIFKKYISKIIFLNTFVLMKYFIILCWPSLSQKEQSIPHINFRDISSNNSHAKAGKNKKKDLWRNF